MSDRKRGRELGLPFPGQPGEWNAITDVPGVEVGQVTLISGAGALRVGHGPVRTGVTAILPRGKAKAHVPCAAGYYSLNGNGEMTGVVWIEESGELQTPITITNTHSCGVTRDATIRWLVGRGVGTGQDWGLPVAAETYDGDLNDINGFHVTAEHTIAALDKAGSGPVAMGSVGGGTGMLTYDFKAGNGSASRIVEIAGQRFTLGVFVQSNFGRREDFTVLGVPVGRHLLEGKLRGKEQGSVIAIVATDAPLMAHQLKRIARRVPLGLARTGTVGNNSSGDIFLAFSTANEQAFAQRSGIAEMKALGNADIDRLFMATVEATEEAVIDAMLMAETMTGRDGNTAVGLPADALLALMTQYGRM
ncbi:S58 family peptidase [Aestuariivirga litoralis]|uniref:S58 family peptidase n=1 Tax=Aestuariivirga litoralis TaxID=2650924 RepID=A0A2W2ATS1_9HYPH|nr:P1 family peptidase [Aestuariivirga litoralis]PZF78665.1 S58 family peptidase [Aestuariivirga litoralis]